MKTKIFSLLSLVTFTIGAPSLFAHCEVPCGIFADEMRFEQMLEEHTTIAKAITNINELSAKSDALSHNQLARWVATKESHAVKIQETIAQYFMSQRIKTDHENYQNQLVAAHAVMVAAMKSKQSVDVAVADTLRETILDFYRAYEGKEPVALHSHE